MKKSNRKKNTTLFQMWLLPEEKALLRQRANELGVSMSDVLRAFINRMGGQDKPREFANKLDEWSERDE